MNSIFELFMAIFTGIIVFIIFIGLLILPLLFNYGWLFYILVIGFIIGGIMQSENDRDKEQK